MADVRFILAGNHAQYKQYLRETGESPRQSVSLGEAAQLQGLRDVLVVRYGTWWQNPVSRSADLATCGTLTLTATAAALMTAGLEYHGAHVCESELHPLLQRLAAEHARYQADRHQQGHQGFQKRFDEVHASLGLFAAEIAAESWKRQANASLAELGKEMFHCWEQSPGHWKVASRKHAFFGGEMAKGKNGIWYACILAAD